MSAIALKALTIATNFLEDRIREKVYADLKRSDVTGQHFREFIMRTLDSIQEKLDGLARVDLLASLNFFKDGITLLYGSMESRQTSKIEDKGDQNKESISDEKVEGLFPGVLQSLAALGITSGPSENQSEKAEETSEISKCDGVDQTFITEAKLKFQKSVEHATRAISNEGLKVDDRIFASKLRIMSTLLEHVDNSALSLTLCHSYIEQLNGMEEVSNTFAIQFGTGTSAAMKKLFNPDERKEFIWAVIAINRTMWHYARLFDADGTYFWNWPRIRIKDDEEIHPILDSRVQELFQISFGDGGDKEWLLNCPQGLAVDSDCNIVVADTCNHKIKVFSPLGTYMYCFETHQEQEGVFWPRCVCIDKRGNIFVGSSKGRREDQDQPAKIIVFDKQGKFLYSFGLEIFSHSAVLTSMSIDPKDQLLVSDDHLNAIHVFNLDGQYVSRTCAWEEHEGYTHIAVTDTGTILATHWDHIRIYDKEGTYVSKFLAKEHGLPLEGIVYDSQREWVYVFSKAYKHLDKFRTPNVQIYNNEWNLMGTIELPKSYRSSKAMAITPNGYITVVNVDGNEITIA